MLRPDKHWKVLELDRVLEKLAAVSGNPDAAALARALTPSGDFKEVSRLLTETEAAYRLIGLYGSPSFGGMTNVRSAARRAEAGASLSPRELLDVAENLRVYRSLKEWRARFSDESPLDRLFEGVLPQRQVENRLTAAILSEEEIADGASPALADIRRRIRTAENSVREKLDRLIRSTQFQKYLQEPVVTIRGDRFVVPGKLECRSSVPGLVHDTSSSGATVFIEPTAVVEANNEIKVLRATEEAEIERILAELSALVGEHADAIALSYDCAVELCLIFAKGKLGYDMKASLPLLNEEGRVRLDHARHPLLDPAKVVPVTVELGLTFDTLVITGPNTGGKTVTLKTIGLLCLMAACGLMIPARDESQVAVFDLMMADIGDEQSIEQSLSTFSSHMVNLVDVMEAATDRSLVLADELGAGTDPVEGAALAQAILEALRRKGCRVAATTHYAELKAYAIETEGVENACCEFDVNTLRPTYRLLIGVPGRSNAFAISRRLGLPAEVVEEAKSLISVEDKRFEGVVRSLEQARRAAESE
ncbi:MAG: endonuclease MutS2, partial [Clostridia bacterium]|nr:endonuclease MutS2 [Clostridia bacterium]